MNSSKQAQCKFKVESLSFDQCKEFEELLDKHDEFYRQLYAAKVPGIDEPETYISMMKESLFTCPLLEQYIMTWYHTP